jgi:dTDP-4-dehydrorhamnose reductase
VKALGAGAVPLSRPDFDLRDPASLKRAVESANPDAVICAAGLASADRCEDEPGEAYALNVDGARSAAEAARGRPFAIFSTDHVFDGREGPYGEDAKPNPINVYGRTKQEMERIVGTIHPRALLIRTTLVFAPGDRSFLATLLQAREPVGCWTDHVGTYTWGPALAEATIELLERGATGLWHLAGPELLNRHDFALKAAAAFGKDPGLYRPASIHDRPPRAPRPLRAGLKTDKARRELRTKLPTVDEALRAAAAG